MGMDNLVLEANRSNPQQTSRWSFCVRSAKSFWRSMEISSSPVKLVGWKWGNPLVVSTLRCWVSLKWKFEACRWGFYPGCGIYWGKKGFKPSTSGIYSNKQSLVRVECRIWTSMPGRDWASHSGGSNLWICRKNLHRWTVGECSLSSVHWAPVGWLLIQDSKILGNGWEWLIDVNSIADCSISG